MAAPKEKSNIITAFVLDFETGGLDCQKSAATQLSIHAVRLDNFEVMETFNAYIYPYSYQALEKPQKKVLKSKYDIQDPPKMEYSDKALEYSAITMDMLEEKGVQLQAFCEDVIDFFKRNTFNVQRSYKPFLVGQNVTFDIGFLQQILMYTGLWGEFAKIIRGNKDYWGNFQPFYVDTIIISQLAMSHKRTADKWNLETLCNCLNIELDDAHDADADVTATREVLRVLTARMRNEDENADGESSLVVTKKTKTREHFKI